jgi:hypothetical protein
MTEINVDVLPCDSGTKTKTASGHVHARFTQVWMHLGMQLADVGL